VFIGVDGAAVVVELWPEQASRLTDARYTQLRSVSSSIPPCFRRHEPTMLPTMLRMAFGGIEMVSRLLHVLGIAASPLTLPLIFFLWRLGPD
jgi:hypothetical protein